MPTINKEVTFRGFVPVTLYDGRVCAWDCETPSEGLFCEKNQERYDTAKDDLKRMFYNLKDHYHQERKSFKNEFKTPTDLIRFCVLESMIRLSSPKTGYYYGSYRDLNEVLPYSDSTIKNAVKVLENKGKVEMVGTYLHRNVYRVVD